MDRSLEIHPPGRYPKSMKALLIGITAYLVMTSSFGSTDANTAATGYVLLGIFLYYLLKEILPSYRPTK